MSSIFKQDQPFDSSKRQISHGQTEIQPNRFRIIALKFSCRATSRHQGYCLPSSSSSFEIGTLGGRGGRSHDVATNKQFFSVASQPCAKERGRSNLLVEEKKREKAGKATTVDDDVDTGSGETGRKGYRFPLRTS